MATSTPEVPGRGAHEQRADRRDEVGEVGGDDEHYEYVVVPASASTVDLAGAVRRLAQGVRAGLRQLDGAAVPAVLLAFVLTFSIAAILTACDVDLLDIGVRDADQAPIDWLRIGALVVVSALGGALTNESDPGGEAFHHAGSYLLFTGLLLGGIYAALRRTVHRRPRPVDLRHVVATSSAAAAVAAACVVALSLVSAGPVTGMEEMDLHARSWTGPLVAFVLVLGVCLAALTPAAPAGAGSSAADVLRRAWSVAAALIATTVGLGATALVAAAPGESIDSWGLPLGDLFTRGFDEWLRLPDVALVLAGVAHGITFVSTGFDDERWGLIAGQVDPQAWFLVVITLAASLVVGVRHAFRRPPGATPWRDVWALPLVYGMMWAAAAWITRNRSWSSGEDDFEYSSGLGLVSAFLCAAAWGGLTLVLGWLCARWVAGWFPRTSARLMGRHVNPGWAGLVQDRLRAENTRVPAYVSRAAAGATGADRPPLRRGHGTSVAGALLVAAALAMIGVPTASAAQCGLPIPAARMDIEPLPDLVAPAAVQRDLDGMKAEVERLDARRAAAEEALGPGLSLQDAVTSAQIDAQAARTALSDAETAVDRATARADRLANVGDWERDMLEQAQADYDEFKEYDSDGFWSSLVEDAEQDLFEAEAPLRRARTALADRQVELDAARANLAQAEADAAAAEAAFAPYEPKLEELRSSTSEARAALAAHDIAERDWRTEAAARQDAVRDANALAAACHDEGRPRVAASAAFAGSALALVPWWVVRRSPRARARRGDSSL